MELAAQYENLLAGGLVLNVEAQRINVDLYCPIVIASLDEVECTPMFATNSASEAVINSTSGTLILSLVISMSILVIFMITIVIIIIVHSRKRKPREDVA